MPHEFHFTGPFGSKGALPLGITMAIFDFTQKPIKLTFLMRGAWVATLAIALGNCHWSVLWVQIETYKAIFDHSRNLAWPQAVWHYIKVSSPYVGTRNTSTHVFFFLKSGAFLLHTFFNLKVFNSFESDICYLVRYVLIQCVHESNNGTFEHGEESQCRPSGRDTVD